VFPSFFRPNKIPSANTLTEKKTRDAIYIFNSHFLLTASDYRETVSAP